jgi:thioredoxin 1
MASEHVKEFTDQNFDAEVLASTEPVLVDFWAEWCMPCVMLGPTIDQIAKDYAGKAKVGKLDIDSNRTVVQKYAIEAVPTILIFKNGEISRKFVGIKSEADLKKAIDAAG